FAMGAAFVDLFGTRRLDLVVTGVGRTFLFVNRGDGTFAEEGEKRGLVAPRFGSAVAAGDVDGDGRVDLYVVNYLETTYAKERAFPMFAIRTPDDYEGQEAFLFVQRPDGHFVERARAAGVSNAGGKGIGAVFFDYDGDGRPDLYVTNDRRPNVLYKGKGDGTFTDVTAETGAGARESVQARAGMGIAVGDVDGDGHPDIVVTNFAGEPNTLYRSIEGQLFDDGTETSGLAAASLPYVEWGVELTDLDDDGRPDLVAASGHLVPKVLQSLARLLKKGGLGPYGLGDRSYKQPPLLWRNAGGGRFTEATAGSGDLARLRLSARGLAAGDLDGDGRVDVVLAALSGGVHVLKNTTHNAAHALEVLPVAGADRRTVLGTKVIVTSGTLRQTQEFVLRPSYASGSWVPLHFGLGEAVSARVEVIPPGETKARFAFDGVAADALYRLEEGRLARVRAFTR
ncbi:MAG TPA: CRTAC1 family protein, partial [Thermoanaerobaculia bacterium]|nr:CRTAC1 family protein [Thermoanaerobaculia bacterium]